MKANDYNLSKFLKREDTKFKIPVYQRNYDWKREQCDKLYSDIIENYEINPHKDYFIGSIVYTSNSLTSKKVYMIIDGQQRITTINLMLLAVTRILEQNGHELANEIWKDYIKYDRDNEENKLKLKHNQKDFIDYQFLVSENYNKIKTGSRILDNYNFFYNKISNTENAIKAFEGFKKLSFVEIGLDQDDDAQKVFQSLNSTGLDLSQADLIRNYVLMNHDHEKQEDIFNKYWSYIEDNTFNKDTLETRTSLFFKDYITFKFNKIPNEKAVFNEFISKFDLNSKNEEEYFKILEEIKTFSKYYSLIINPQEIFDQNLKKEYLKLSILDNTVTYPFLLGVFDEFTNEKISVKEFIEILKLIQSYIIRRYVCNYGTNALRGLFSSLYQNVKNLNHQFPELNFVKSMETVLVQLSKANTLTFPDDIQFMSSLKNRDIYKMPTKYKQYFLEMLENNFHSFNESEFSFSNPLPISIEHIFPQNPSKEWKEQLSIEEYQEMESRCGSLGNLTIVINNSSLGNRTFIYKRDLNLPDSKGFKYSKFNLNATLATLDKWGLEELNNRHEELSQIATKVWKYPKVSTEYEGPPREDIEISIDEIEDTSDKILMALIVDGTKYYVSTYRDAFRKLLSIIQELESEVFYTPQINTVLKISQEKNDLISPVKINDELFAEGNYSANDLLLKMNKLLENLTSVSEIKLKFKIKTDSKYNENSLVNPFAENISNMDLNEYKFWNKFKSYCLQKGLNYKIKEPNRYGLDISLDSKIALVHLSLSSRENSLGVEFYIFDNKEFFNYLLEFKKDIDLELNEFADWRDAPRASKIKLKFNCQGLFDNSHDIENFNLLISKIDLLLKVFLPYLRQYSKEN